MRRRTYKAGAFSRGVWQAAVLFRTLGSCALRDFIGIGWKGTRIPAYLAKHLCCFDAAERMWRLRESKIYRRYPSEIHLASALKSVTVVAIWLPEKNGLLGYFYNWLIIKDKMVGAHGLEPETR